METIQRSAKKRNVAKIRGSITRQGEYVDGEDICEIYIRQEGSDALTHEYGQKIPVKLDIGNTTYIAGVHETKAGVVWIS